MSLREFDELDDLERELWIAEWEEAQAECGECGRPRSECTDPDKVWYHFRTICRATMARTAAQSAYTDLHDEFPYHDGTFTEWAKKQSEDFPFHRDAGVTIGVAELDLHPWDDFTRDPEADPIPPEQRPADPAGEPFSSDEHESR